MSVQRGLCGSNYPRVGRKIANFQSFFQPREQVVVWRGRFRRIGWVIKTLEAQVGQFSGLQVPGQPGHIREKKKTPLDELPAPRSFSFQKSFNSTSRDE